MRADDALPLVSLCAAPGMHLLVYSVVGRMRLPCMGRGGAVVARSGQVPAHQGVLGVTLRGEGGFLMSRPSCRPHSAHHLQRGLR